MERLAQELIDAIIDHFHADRRDLLVCSLVSRSWLPSSQRHLFRRITFYPTNMPDNVCAGEVPYSKRLDRVLISSPHISDYIQELKLYGGQTARGEDWSVIDPTLPHVLRKLRKLERLEIRRLYWNILTADFKWSLCWVLQLPSITCVEIEKAGFSSMDDFACFLSHAKGLAGLSLTDVNTAYRFRAPLVREEAEDPQCPDFHSRRHLSDLRLTLHDYPVFVDWLLSPRSPSDVSHLHTLHILALDQTSGHAINRLLRTIGSSLEHFRLRVPNNRWPSFADQRPVVDINLEFSPNIKSLHLTNIRMLANANVWGTPVDFSLSWLRRLLTTIPTSNRLEHIKLEVKIPNHEFGPPDWSSWEDVDLLLSEAHFKYLRKLEIELWPSARHGGAGLFGETCQSLVAALPLIEGRGILVDAH